jgi:hypothetical protein
MHQICVCFSTGRTGTTYLAHTLKATYPFDADVFHEHVEEFQSKPRKYLWGLDEGDLAVMRADPLIAAHLTEIKERAELRPYVDVGHTATPLVPLLLAMFPGRVRMLHLIRDPLESAASMAVRGMYHPRDDGREGPGYNVPPNPRDTQCIHPEYASRWDAMTPFEKNLWRWGEYHLFALTVHARYPEVPYLRLFSRDLFADQSCLEAIARFYGLPARQLILQPNSRNETHPNLTSAISIGDEWRRYVEYPYILELATQLGVSVQLDRLEERMKKYAAPTAWEIAKYRWKMRLSRQWWNLKLQRLGLRPTGERKGVA